MCDRASAHGEDNVRYGAISIKVFDLYYASCSRLPSSMFCCRFRIELKSEPSVPHEMPLPHEVPPPIEMPPSPSRLAWQARQQTAQTNRAATMARTNCRTVSESSGAGHPQPIHHEPLIDLSAVSARPRLNGPDT